MSDLISRQDAINEIKNVFDDVLCCNVSVQKGLPEAVRRIEMMPSAEPKRKWIPCSNPPKHHRDVLVRGIEAIGNVNVHKVMQWDIYTWRPTDYAPSIIWEEWSEI